MADSRVSAASFGRYVLPVFDRVIFKSLLVALCFQGILSAAIPFIACPISALLLYGALVPMSESAAGGNYNLRYLLPGTRRDITPFPAIQPFSTRAVPDFGFQNGSEYTLYVPGAGFLWSDSMMWKQKVPAGFSYSLEDHHTEEGDDHWSVEGSYSVSFQDKFIDPICGKSRKFDLSDNSTKDVTSAPR